MTTNEVPIEAYDQATLEYLLASGVSPALVERVNRLAKDSARWRMRAEVAELLLSAQAEVTS